MKQQKGGTGRSLGCPALLGVDIHKPITGDMPEALGLRGIPEGALVRRGHASSFGPLVDEIDINAHVVSKRLTAGPVTDDLFDWVSLFHASHSGRFFQNYKVEKTSMGISSRKARLAA